MDDHRARIQQLSIAACVALFESYGLDMRHVAQIAPSAFDMLYCGIVGFSGRDIRGGLVLAGSREALGASNPVETAGIRDWVAELANQLAGRIKSRLLAHDVELQIATPVVLRGDLAPDQRHAWIRALREHCAIRIDGHPAAIVFETCGQHPRFV